MSTTERAPVSAPYLTGSTISAEKPSSYGRPPYLGPVMAVKPAPTLEPLQFAPEQTPAHRDIYEQSRHEDPATRAAELHAHFTEQHMHDIAGSIGAIAGAGLTAEEQHTALNFYDAMRATHDLHGLQQPTPLIVGQA